MWRSCGWLEEGSHPLISANGREWEKWEGAGLGMVISKTGEEFIRASLVLL